MWDVVTSYISGPAPLWDVVTWYDEHNKQTVKEAAFKATFEYVFYIHLSVPDI